MKTRQRSPRLAVLILAHNEAGVITRSVASAVAGLDPAETVFVVADNCTDQTAAVAARAGGRVLKRSASGARGKGKALAWFMEKHLALVRDLAYLVILDADSRLETGFAQAVRERCAGSEAAFQCFVYPECSEKAPIGRLAALSELIDQYASDRIRSSLGWPVRLRGTGMVIQPSHLRRVCKRLQTEVEDIALSLLLASNGVRIERIDEARVFDPKPETTSAAASQRARWFHGQWMALWHYRREILQLLLKGPGHWSLLGSLFLKPKWLFFAIGSLLAVVLLHWPWLAWPFGLLVAGEAAYLAWGLSRIPERGRYVRALVHLPAFIWMWMRGIADSLHSSAWRRARE